MSRGPDGDELADRPAASDCRCEGSGWIQVHENYARHLANGDEERLAAFLDSWYPCKWHNRDQFFRWVDGHLKSGHNTKSCSRCRDEPRRARRDRSADRDDDALEHQHQHEEAGSR